MPTLTNWARNLTFEPARFHEPESLDELRHIVANGSNVRVLGSGHSFSDLASTGGDLISLVRLPPSVHIDEQQRTATVTGRTTYAELGQHLHAAGYALPALASLPHISVAGGCATATHGSGEGLRNLAASVAALEMVTSTGETVTLSRDDPRWDGVVVNLGALGVVTRLTLDVVETFDVAQYVYEGLPLAELLTNFDEIFASAYSVSLFTDWTAPTVKQAWVKQRITSASPSPVQSFFGATPADGPRHPVTGSGPRAVHCTQQQGAPGPWHERIPHFRAGFTPSSGEELQSEYLVPRTAATQALRAIDAVRHHVAPVLQICEVRTIAADGLWLSPCYQRDMVALHFTWILDEGAVLPAVRWVEDALTPFGAVPHWGKIFTMTPEYVRARYPKIDDFQKLATEFDPAGIFANRFVSTYVR